MCPWPCNDTSNITHFPETPGDLELWLGLRGTRCLAEVLSLGIASAMAHDERLSPSTC